jgi:hypothetical protein
MNSNKCLDLYGGDTMNGKLVEIWDCDNYGGTNSTPSAVSRQTASPP